MCQIQLGPSVVGSGTVRSEKHSHHKYVYLGLSGEVSETLRWER